MTDNIWKGGPNGSRTRLLALRRGSGQPSGASCVGSGCRADYAAALAEGQPGFDALRTHLWALVFRFLWEALGDA